MSRLMLGLFLVGTLIATAVAVALIGTVGLVLLVLAALIAVALFLDESLTLHVRRRGSAAMSSSSTVPKAHIEADDDTPLGASPEVHEEISSLDVPSDSPAYRAVRRQERRSGHVGGR